METPKNSHLQSTLDSLTKALADWDQIDDHTQNEAEEFRKKTRDLIEKLKNQIDDLGL